MEKRRVRYRESSRECFFWHFILCITFFFYWGGDRETAEVALIPKSTLPMPTSKVPNAQFDQKVLFHKKNIQIKRALRSFLCLAFHQTVSSFPLDRCHREAEPPCGAAERPCVPPPSWRRHRRVLRRGRWSCA
jgi:hypothetical protein